MGYCIVCKRQINDKYEMCYSCLEKHKNDSPSRLMTFICKGCGHNVHSMKWPGHLCCNCYNHIKKLKREEKEGRE